MSKVVYEGYACTDCASVIANDDWSGIEYWQAHSDQIANVDLAALGHVVMACPEDCEGEFRTDSCDYCGTTLAGDRHPIAVLS